MGGQRVVAGSIHRCQRCGCNLRIPPGVGGLVMVCPECGERFHTVFKIGPVLQRNDASSEPPRRGFRLLV